MLRQFGLVNCKDTYIGGWNIKGVSGGELKRCSIAYEMVTNPMLLMLDEPTSGLDSFTAKKIIRLARREAHLRKMSIIATIHQPSGEVFQMFDRVLILHDGYMIYQGLVKNVPDYIKTFGINLGKYSNPADFLLRMTQSPESCAESLTFDHLKDFYIMQF